MENSISVTYVIILLLWKVKRWVPLILPQFELWSRIHVWGRRDCSQFQSRLWKYLETCWFGTWSKLLGKTKAWNEQYRERRYRDEWKCQREPLSTFNVNSNRLPIHIFDKIWTKANIGNCLYGTKVFTIMGNPFLYLSQTQKGIHRIYVITSVYSIMFGC